MLRRKYLFPHVIEMNYQAGRRLGVNVYLIDGGTAIRPHRRRVPRRAVDDIVELIRQMDFNLSTCKMIVATHADADHIQGLARARRAAQDQGRRPPHERRRRSRAATRSMTYATIKAQNIDIPMPRCKVDLPLNEGDVLTVGDLKLDVWHTPGHTPGQLSFKMGNLLFCGDNIYKDSCVGVIDAHHGSNLPDFIQSLKRILRRRRGVPAAQPRAGLPPRQRRSSRRRSTG